MDILKKYFPFSFQAKNDVAALVINIIIHLVVGLVIGLVLKLVSLIPVINILVGIVGGVVELYLFIGIVLSVLDYLKILK